MHTPQKDSNHIMYRNLPTVYTKSISDLDRLVLKGDWIELIKISKDVIQPANIKDAAVEYVFECLRHIADNNFHTVEINPMNSTECSTNLLSIITSRHFQSLNGRDVILDYLGRTMIEICALDSECYYTLINIANNSEIKSNISLKALAAYYRLLFNDDGTIIEKYKLEIDYAVRHLNVRYVNILMMTYDLDAAETESIYLLLNYIRSKRD
jgi:hypothetical protein